MLRQTDDTDHDQHQNNGVRNLKLTLYTLANGMRKRLFVADAPSVEPPDS